jgi:signal peptidase II
MDAMKALPGWTKITALSVIVLDESTKVLARLMLPLCSGHGCPFVHLFGPVDLVRIRNAGSAFGFLQGLWLWTAIAMVAAVSIPLLARKAAGRLLLVGGSLAAGAALGNLLDRVVTGGVTDFIYPGGPTVFNLADVALAIGCTLMTWHLASRNASRSSA